MSDYEHHQTNTPVIGASGSSIRTDAVSPLLWLPILPPNGDQSCSKLVPPLHICDFLIDGAAEYPLMTAALKGQCEWGF